MTIKTTRARKPDLLVLVTFFVAVGFLATSATQADDTAQVGGSESWWQSIWGLDLSEKLTNWHPMISAHDDGEGLYLAQLFGNTGPTLQVTSTMPGSVMRSLRGGGDSQIGAVGSSPNAFLFLQKRW